MNELSFEGWKFFLKNAFYYPSAWYFVYWAIPLLVMLALIAYYRNKKSGGGSAWKQTGRNWKRIGLLLCGVVLTMYGLTIYSVPRLVFNPIGLTVPMLTIYQQRVAGSQDIVAQGADAVIANLEKMYSASSIVEEGVPNRLILFFYEKYQYLHSSLFAFIYVAFFACFFVIKGHRIERARWALTSVSRGSSIGKDVPRG